MNIGIDLDDTITDIFEHKLAFAYKYDIEKFGGNNLIDPLKRRTNQMFNWSKQNDFDFFKDGYLDKLKNVKPRIFARDIINKLYDEGNNIYIITARSNHFFDDAYLQTKEYLNKNEIKYTDVIYGMNEKENTCMEYKIDVFIDDSEKHCINVSNLGIKTYLFTTMRNLNFDIENTKIERVFCWTQLYDKILKNM